jgi:uncharacterized protein (DUF1499 family)
MSSAAMAHGWRMTDQSTTLVAPAARWSGRFALFSVGLLVVSLCLHRFTSFPTRVAMNLFAVGFAGAGLAMLIGLVALVQIWRTGCGGAGSMALGILLPLAAFTGPMGYAVTHNNLPRINDVTTDTTSPPQYVALAKRPHGANSSAYAGPQVAAQQVKAYPDLRTLVLERSAEDAFEMVEEAVRRLRWRVVAAEPPAARPPRPGTLEATDQTLIVGFTDDIVVRVEGSATRARIDVRSASRYGTFDFGQNAARVRRFLAEVQARVEATSIASRRGAARARALLKRQKGGDPQKAGGRSARGPGQSDAQRAPAQKERQR